MLLMKQMFSNTLFSSQYHLQLPLGMNFPPSSFGEVRDDPVTPKVPLWKAAGIPLLLLSDTLLAHSEEREVFLNFTFIFKLGPVNTF